MRRYISKFTISRVLHFLFIDDKRQRVALVLLLRLTWWAQFTCFDQLHSRERCSLPDSLGFFTLVLRCLHRLLMPIDTCSARFNCWNRFNRCSQFTCCDRLLIDEPNHISLILVFARHMALFINMCDLVGSRPHILCSVPFNGVFYPVWYLISLLLRNLKPT